MKAEEIRLRRSLIDCLQTLTKERLTENEWVLRALTSYVDSLLVKEREALANERKRLEELRSSILSPSSTASTESFDPF